MKGKKICGLRTYTSFFFFLESGRELLSVCEIGWVARLNFFFNVFSLTFFFLWKDWMEGEDRGLNLRYMAFNFWVGSVDSCLQPFSPFLVETYTLLTPIRWKGEFGAEFVAQFTYLVVIRVRILRQFLKDVPKFYKEWGNGRGGRGLNTRRENFPIQCSLISRRNEVENSKGGRFEATFFLMTNSICRAKKILFTQENCRVSTRRFSPIEFFYFETFLRPGKLGKTKKVSKALTRVRHQNRTRILMINKILEQYKECSSSKFPSFINHELHKKRMWDHRNLFMFDISTTLHKSHYDTMNIAHLMSVWI